MDNTHVQLVWFKRDLRVVDHALLRQATERGPVLPLYIAEPGLWEQPDTAARHWAFIAASLLEPRQVLATLGQPLVVRVGEITRVLQDLQQRPRSPKPFAVRQTPGSRLAVGRYSGEVVRPVAALPPDRCWDTA